MDYTHLGRSGLRVSRLCLGMTNFGSQTSEEDSFAIMNRAHEHGINFFDTANTYGWRKGEGWTEQILGRWFGQGGGRRERTVLATKLYSSMSDWPNDTFLSALNIRRACELLTEHREKVEAYEAFCAELGEHPADVGIAWLLHQPAVTAPILGPRTVEQLDASLQALEISLGDKELARLDEISPGPGGPPPRPTPGEVRRTARVARWLVA